MSNYKYTEIVGDVIVTLETDDADFMEDYIAKSNEPTVGKLEVSSEDIQDFIAKSFQDNKRSHVISFS